MTSSSEQNKAIVLRFNKEFLEENNANALQELVADNFINHTAPPGVPANREGLLIFVKAFHSAFSDIRVVIYDQVSEGDKVVTRKAIEATHTGPFMNIAATGKRVALPLIDIIRLENGKYAEHWAVRDTQSLLQQLSGK